MNTFHVTDNERAMLRELAAAVAELAATKQQRELRELWDAHHRLERTRTLFLVNIGDSWPEVFTVQMPRDHPLHGVEWGLRHSLAAAAIGFDNPASDTLTAPYYFNNTDYGLPAPLTHGADVGSGKGSYVWDPPIKTETDLARLRGDITVDLTLSRERFEFLRDLFDGILPVKLQDGYRLSMDDRISFLRGTEQVMMDMYDQPEFLHRLMRFISETTVATMRRMENQQLLGFRDDGRPRTLGDCTVGQSSQTFAGVAPAMFREFLLAYQKPYLELFGESAYGCCEPLHDRLDAVMTIANLRQITVCPWSDAAICAEKIGNRYRYAWRQHPVAVFAATFDVGALRRNLTAVRDLTRANDCRVNVTLQDVSTTNHRPERFQQWLRLAAEIFNG